MSTAPVSFPLGVKSNEPKEMDSADLHYLSQKGVTKKDLLHLAKFLNLTLKEISELLPVTYRTLQRYRPGQRFGLTLSEHILEISQVCAKGIDVFDDKEMFIEWLNSPILGLGNVPPITLLSSHFGCDLVKCEMGRLEHGVYS